MTTMTPTTADRPGTTPSTRRSNSHTRWWAAGAAALALAAGVTAVVAFDDSSPDRTVVRDVQTVDGAERTGSASDIGPVSADAAERRAVDSNSALVARCSGLSADAAERCMTGG